MVVRADGVLRGGSVELETPITALPEGSRVTIELRPREIPLAEKRRLAKTLAGAWASDTSLGPIFDEIDRQRHASTGRPVSLDDPR